MSKKARLLGTAGVIAVMSISVQAQAAGADQKLAKDSAGNAASVETITVTGTRIANSSYEAPTPVTALQANALASTAPASWSEALNQLPEFTASINIHQSQGSQASNLRTGSFLNLRALGPQRELVLLDGHRLAPSGTIGAVDISLIPELLTKRVEIVTGGASAAYGSDAVSGVVNFILNKRLEGLRYRAQVGFATNNGGYDSNYRIGIAGGTSFLNGRLHIVASAERYHSNAVPKTDIPIIARRINPSGLGTAADPIVYTSGNTIPVITQPGRISPSPAAGPIRGMQFNPDGTVSPYDGKGGATDGPCCTITPSMTKDQFFIRPEFEFTDNITGAVSVGYSQATYKDANIPELRSGFTIFSNNAYLAPSVVAALGARPSFQVGRVANELGGLPTTNTSKSLMISTEFNGNFGDSFTWNIAYTHHRTEQKVSTLDILNQHFYAATDAVKDSSGNIVCNVTLTNPGLYPGCVPLDFLGIGNVTKAAYNYITAPSISDAVNTLDSIEASLSGNLLQLPAGPISFAVGADWRTQSLNLTSNSNPAIPTDFTGLRAFSSKYSNKFQWLNTGVADGSYDVTEGFLELEGPVFKDSAIGTLSWNAAGRVTNYSNSGVIETWKVGGIYAPVDGVRFRATLSRDIRAPNLYELYAGQTTRNITFVDQLTGGQHVFPQEVSGGNPNLKPEVADTFTGGVVLKPDAVPGLYFSADYWDIKTKDAIATPFSSLQIVDLCAASNYTSPLCNQIVRPLGPTNTSPANAPTEVFVNNQNVASQHVSGIDFEARYGFDALGGYVKLHLTATRLIRYDQVNAPGQPVLKYAGTADLSDGTYPIPLPQWRGTGNVTYSYGAFQFSVQGRYIGAYDRSHLLVYAEKRVGAVFYTDLSVSYDMPVEGNNMQLFATVNNAFNEQPPIAPVSRIPGGTVPTIRSTYDILGPLVTIGIRSDF